MKVRTKLSLIALIALQGAHLFSADASRSRWPKIRKSKHTEHLKYPCLVGGGVGLSCALASLAISNKNAKNKLADLGLALAIPSFLLSVYADKKERKLQELHEQLQKALYAQRPLTEIKAILEQIPTIHPTHHMCLPLLLANYGNEMELWPVVKMMLERGASPNARTQDHTTLGYALRKGHLQIAKLLLDAGAKTYDEFITTVRGFYEQGPKQIKIARLLLDHGADITKEYHDGTALHLAVNHWDDSAMAELLFEYGAISLINKRDQQGKTPLLAAAQAINPKCTRLLLELGADIAAQDNDGNSVHTVAKRNDYIHYVLNDYYKKEIHRAARQGLTDAQAKKFKSKSEAEQQKIKSEGFFEPDGGQLGDLNNLVADYIAGPLTTDPDTKLAAEGIAEMLSNQENDQQAETETLSSGLGGTRAALAQAATETAAVNHAPIMAWA